MHWAGVGVLVALLGWWAYPDSPTVIGGATAICQSGAYSVSQTRRGTCAHHGGVKKWLTE